MTTMSDDSAQSVTWGRLPPLASRLGYAGWLPFVIALACVAGAEDPELRAFGLQLALGWGAAILAFLGAIHWGLALAGRWSWSLSMATGSVLPSVWATASVIVGGSRGLALLLVGFGLLWLYEHRQIGAALPPPYLALRRILSLGVCALLALTVIASEGVAS